MPKSVVACVLPGSIAEEAGIEQGDTILSINDNKIKDIFDYRFFIADESLTIEVQKPDGEVWEIEIEKDEYDDLGVEFENSLIDEEKSCTNKCIFCFIDQLPKGMRHTLYFKDDDSRLSFLTGNYVTLTNINFDDIDRIIRYRMTPINVSVHATSQNLRIKMLNNRFAGDVMDKIKRLVGGGITVNCQIVLCRGINDSKELEKSVSELAALYPGVSSVSVVPVGLTKYREGLSDLQPFDKASSEAVISVVQRYQNEFLEKYGSRIVYLADEFYIMSEMQIPSYEDYEDFPQIENGVGLLAMLKNEFEECLLEYLTCVANGSLARTVSIATGVSAYMHIKEMAEILENKFEGLRVYIYEIKNEFFGENVTVTGLLTGSDIAAQLKDKPLGDELLLSRSMFKAGEDLFLDDYTSGMIEEKLGVKVAVVENSGRDLIEKVLGKVV